ncbi:MAG TPA: preprotein translocase subunit SecG [Blastocatellia bacterium]|nr:preprotein translocase subunit SecG [Blastocatellia bacterium]
MTLYVIACFVLILFVLLQPGKSDAAAVFGGGANSSAFGPRGTATVLAKVTIGAAILFFLIAFVFSIPNLFSRGSLGERVGPAQTAPQAPVIPPAGTEQPAPAVTTESPAPAPSPGPSQPAKQGKQNGNSAPAKQAPKKP